MKTLIIVLLALLASCTNTTDPYLTDDRCIKSHVTYTVIPMTSTSCNGKTCMTMTRMALVPITHCDQHIYTIYQNPNYKEPEAQLNKSANVGDK